MKHRLQLDWEEENFLNKTRWVCKFTEDIYFTYNWVEALGEYQCNIWLKNESGWASIGQKTFDNINQHFEEWFMQHVIKYTKIFRKVEEFVLENVSLAVIFDKSGFVVENPDRPYKLRD